MTGTGAAPERAAGRSDADHGWYPYLLPYAAFLVLVEIGNRAGEDATGVMLALKTGVPLALLVAFARRGAYPELRGFRAHAGGAWLDALLGVAIAALWMGPVVAGWLAGPDTPEGFDPQVHGKAWAPALLGLRALGFAGVTPFVEELFVRSFLLRLVDVYAYRGPTDFRDIPIARYTRWSFAVTVAWFTFTHVPWEWPAALVTGVIWNLWLYHRGHIGALVVSHAAANAGIFAAVVLTSSTDGSGPDLWYFL